MRPLRLLLATIALILPVSTQALTLQDLNAGASFRSTGGELDFDFAPGSISLAGAFSADLSQYAVLPTASGFIVSGPLAALGPAAFGGLVLSYTVSAGPGLALASANGQASGVAFGPGAAAIATLGLSNGAGFGIVLTAAGGSGSSASAAFTPVQSLNALAGIQLFALTPGDVASFGAVQHGFGWLALPEPAQGVLLGAGLLGLALFGSRRNGGPRAA